MLGFDKLFDLNKNNKLDFFERMVQLQFLDEIGKDERDVFGDAGLDYEELEFMDPTERRSVLEEAGLDPDEFDF